MSECSKSKYCYKVNVHACLHEETDKGHIWFNTKKIASRSIVKIKSKNSKKSVYCELLQIDNNYKKIYNKPEEISTASDKTDSSKASKKNERGIKRFLIFAKTKDVEYNNDTIVINKYYRDVLKIETSKGEEEYCLKIKEVNNIYGRVRACIGHPQVAIRLATWIGLISVLFGLVSIFLSNTHAGLLAIIFLMGIFIYDLLNRENAD